MKHYYQLALFRPNGIPEIFFSDEWEPACETIMEWTKDMDVFEEDQCEVFFISDDDIFSAYCYDYLLRRGLVDMDEEEESLNLYEEEEINTLEEFNRMMNEHLNECEKDDEDD